MYFTEFNFLLFSRVPQFIRLLYAGSLDVSDAEYPFNKHHCIINKLLEQKHITPILMAFEAYKNQVTAAH